MQTPTDTQLHERAHKRVEFRIHFIVFCVVNGALWIVWFVTGHGYIWPIWPLAGWGIGLVLHYIFDYRASRLFFEEEEYKKLKREIEENSGFSQ